MQRRSRPHISFVEIIAIGSRRFQGRSRPHGSSACTPPPNPLPFLHRRSHAFATAFLPGKRSQPSARRLQNRGAAKSSHEIRRRGCSPAPQNGPAQFSSPPFARICNGVPPRKALPTVARRFQNRGAAKSSHEIRRRGCSPAPTAARAVLFAAEPAPRPHGGPAQLPPPPFARVCNGVPPRKALPTVARRLQTVERCVHISFVEIIAIGSRRFQGRSRPHGSSACTPPPNPLPFLHRRSRAFAMAFLPGKRSQPSPDGFKTAASQIVA